MAIAGKAGITLEGEWNATKQYERLTGVRYNNNLFFSRKKPPIGEAPAEGEYWMLAVEGVSEDEWAALLDGTTIVGNADKLDGHDSTEFLKTSGGTVTGRVYMRSANTKNNMSVFGYNDAVFLRNETDGNNYIDIQLQTTEPYIFKAVEGSGKSYKLLHGGDKPSGSYTGNGDATTRTINIGGNGMFCAIIGNGYTAIVDTQGAIYWQYAEIPVGSIPMLEIKFVNGVLTIANDNAIVNKAGTTYYYHVLL